LLVGLVASLSILCDGCKRWVTLNNAQWSHDGKYFLKLHWLFIRFYLNGGRPSSVFLVTILVVVVVFVTDDSLLDEGVDLGVDNVDPTRLVGILVGVPSSLTSDKVEPARDVGRDPLGVTLDRTGIDVFVVSVLEGVRRPKDAESE